MSTIESDLKTIKRLSALQLVTTGASAATQKEGLDKIVNALERVQRGAEEDRATNLRSQEFSADIEWLRNSDDEGKLEFLTSKFPREIGVEWALRYLGGTEAIPAHYESYAESAVASSSVNAVLKDLSKAEKALAAVPAAAPYSGFVGGVKVCTASAMAVLVAVLLVSAVTGIVDENSRGAWIGALGFVSMFAAVCLVLYAGRRQRNRYFAQRTAAQKTVDDAKLCLERARRSRAELEVKHGYLIQVALVADMARPEQRLLPMFDELVSAVQERYPSLVRVEMEALPTTVRLDYVNTYVRTLQQHLAGEIEEAEAILRSE